MARIERITKGDYFPRSMDDRGGEHLSNPRPPPLPAPAVSFLPPPGPLSFSELSPAAEIHTPLPYAIPVLDITDRQGASRVPGLLRSLGVAAILIGILGLACNGAVIVLTPNALARKPAVLNAGNAGQVGPPLAPAVTVPTLVKPYPGEITGPKGWKKIRRESFISKLHEPSLNPDRIEILHRLLGEVGTQLEPAENGPVQLQQSHLPAGRDGIKDRGTTVIVGAGWCLAVDDNSATFRSKHFIGDNEQLAVDWDQVSTRGTVLPVPPISAVSVSERIDILHAHLGTGLNRLQAQAIAETMMQCPPRNVLGGPFGNGAKRTAADFLYLEPEDRPRIDGQTIVFGNGQYQFPPDGSIPASNPVSPRVLRPTSVTAPNPIPRPTSIRVPVPPFDRLSLTVSLIESIASFPLALALLLSGIAATTGNPASPGWLRRYAWLKLAVVVAHLLTAAVVLTPAASNKPGLASREFEIYSFGLAFGIFITAVFPMILLVGSRAATVQDFIEPSGSGVRFFPHSFRSKWSPRFRRLIRSPGGRVSCIFSAVLAISLAVCNARRALLPNQDGELPFYSSPAFNKAAAIGCILAALAAVTGLLVVVDRTTESDGKP